MHLMCRQALVVSTPRTDKIKLQKELRKTLSKSEPTCRSGSFHLAKVQLCHPLSPFFSQTARFLNFRFCSHWELWFETTSYADVKDGLGWAGLHRT